MKESQSGASNISSTKIGSDRTSFDRATESTFIEPIEHQPILDRVANSSLFVPGEPAEILSDRPPETSVSSFSPIEREATETSQTPSIPSVDRLSDVLPSDWAYSALQSLAERYGCIAGYPDGTYRGNSTLTRYEFAAGLNSCLDAIEGLLVGDLSEIYRADLETLQRLRDSFAAELAELQGTLDGLETRTALLEAQQFSTTTKLKGQVLTYFADAFGEEASDANSTIFGYRARLSFISSFSGRDRLLVRLQGINLRRLDTATEFPEGRLSGATNETRFLRSGISGDGDVRLQALSYRFPVGEKLTVSVNPFTNSGILTERIGPFASPTKGAITYFGATHPTLNPISLQSGATAQWDVNPWLNLDFSIGSERGASNNPEIGLFDGGYAASVRSVFDFDALRFSLTYIHFYSLSGADTRSGSNAARVSGAGPVVGSAYVSGIAYEVSPKFRLGASAGLISARSLGEGTKGDARVLDYRFFFAFPDLGQKGNLGGIVLGMQPRLTDTSNPLIAQAIGFPEGQRNDRDTGFHIEAFYTHYFNDNIAITPGIVWLTAPNHDARNSDVIMGVIRTSFTF
ncbi:MAG: iron uptake porin [Cyanobacteriota bacterium]|nr:iron uptake porin [Cyanobacteriota bacterium]